MMTPSKSLIRSCMLLRTSVKSPRTVQQIHPFITSMMLSSELSTRMFSSTPTSPNSFSMTANFILCSVLVKMWFSKVVFPEPRKPVNTVTGSRLSSVVSLMISLDTPLVDIYLMKTINPQASGYYLSAGETVEFMCRVSMWASWQR